MSWNIKTPGDYINGPLTVAGDVTVRTNKLVVTSTGVGAGTTFPQAPFEIAAAASAKAKALQFSTVGSPYYGWIFAVDGAVNGNMILQSNNNTTIADVLEFARSTGNIALGVAPSAFSLSGYKALEIGVSGNSIFSGLGDLNISTNAYYNSAAGGWKYAASSIQATLYNQNAGQHRWFNAASGTVNDVVSGFATPAMTLNANSALVLKSGNVSANGVGITFPATQSASTDANTLDDYEEGNWTGTLQGGTTNPSTPVTATGSYTKVGRVVTVQIAFENVNTTGASGVVLVSGLPFANSSIRAYGVGQSESGVTFSGTLGTRIAASGTIAYYIATTSGAGGVDGTHNAGSGRYFWINITYTV